EKYANHPDSERIIAREMGWSWLEEALDQQEEEKEPEQEHEKELEDLEAKTGEEKEDDNDIEDYELPPPDPMREGIDWVHDQRGRGRCKGEGPAALGAACVLSKRAFCDPRRRTGIDSATPIPLIRAPSKQ